VPRLTLRSGSVRAELVLSQGALQVTVHDTPHLGSGRFMQQYASRPAVMLSGRAQEEQVDFLRLALHDPRLEERLTGLLSRHGLNPRGLSRHDQDEVQFLLGEAKRS